MNDLNILIMQTIEMFSISLQTAEDTANRPSSELMILRSLRKRAMTGNGLTDCIKIAGYKIFSKPSFSPVSSPMNTCTIAIPIIRGRIRDEIPIISASLPIGFSTDKSVFTPIRNMKNM
ncbi:hypothetical protein CsSME_00006716 [Camellia sinensis var. sinensis]